MVVAWLFDSETGSINQIDYHRNQGDVNKLLAASCFIEAIHPREYNLVQDILNIPSPLNVSPYNIRTTQNYTYKLWGIDVENEERNGPGVRFFKNKAIFFKKVIVFKTVNVEKNDVDMNVLTKYLFNQISDDDFYKLGELVDCEDISNKCQFIKADTEKIGRNHLFVIESNLSKISITDMLYTCAFCEKCCIYNKCSRCNKTFYCNKECQEKHWGEHKKVCKKKN
jgi:hypothetical protein